MIDRRSLTLKYYRTLHTLSINILYIYGSHDLEVAVRSERYLDGLMDQQSLSLSVCACMCVRAKIIWSSPSWHYRNRHSSSVPIMETRTWIQPVTKVESFCGWSFSEGVGEVSGGVGEYVKDLTGPSTCTVWLVILLCACLCTEEHVSWFQNIDTFKFLMLNFLL
jgi:hypothetical protein